MFEKLHFVFVCGLTFDRTRVTSSGDPLEGVGTTFAKLACNGSSP